MSLGDEFQVTLASNVSSNKRNKPAAFETALAKPLELPGEWEVALIDLSYPHNWTNLEKKYSVVILTNPHDESEEYKFPPAQQLEQEMATLFKQHNFPEMMVKGVFDIQAGNYTVEDIVNQMKARVKQIPILSNINITYDENTHKVTFTQDKEYVLGVYYKDSILHLLGLSKQTTPVQYKGSTQYEYLKLEPNKVLVSKLNAHIKRLTSIFVYSDIVELSLVGDSQSALLGYCPIQSTFGEQGYWCFNPPYYVKVRERYINNIRIEMCTDTGDIFPIDDGRVYCRLNFRRIGYIR